jgi:ABC-type transport system involved in multi-copper enzyme maturation permease subunit
MGLWIMAGVTFREAARKKMLWLALLGGGAFLALFATGLHFQARDFARSTMPPLVRRQFMSAIIQVGMYAVDLLAVLMTILISVDALSGELASGTIHAIATKPIPRWQILMGKWTGFAGMVAIFVAFTFGGVSAVGYLIGGVLQPHVLKGGLLVFAECLLVLSVTFCCGTWFSTLTNGVIVLSLHGLAFIGGWIEQIGSVTHSRRLLDIGVIASLLMPSESLWRRATFEMQSSLAKAISVSPMVSFSSPSGVMVGYAIAYLLASLAVATMHFSRRDL